MTRGHTLCRLHAAGSTMFGNALDAGGYLAADAVDALPRALRREDRIVLRGYVVGFGQWFFFPALEPALAFGRAARMSSDCSGYGVYEAARVTQFCEQHYVDERVLLVSLRGGGLDRQAREVEHLKRFVQAVKEHPWSSHWHDPTGYITKRVNADTVKTRQPSLPL